MNGAVLLPRRHLRKDVVARLPEQASVLPETSKAFHFLLSLGPGAVSSGGLSLCPHPLPHQTVKDRSQGHLYIPGLMHGLLWAVPCARPLPTPPFHPVDYLHLAGAGAPGSPGCSISIVIQRLFLGFPFSQVSNPGQTAEVPS